MNLRKQITRVLSLTAVLCFFPSCSNIDGAHTTSITYIPPPTHQVLIVVSKPVPAASSATVIDPSADPTKPLLTFHLENGKTVRVGEEVPFSFSAANAKLKGDGGEFRVRYIVDDDEMKWLDTTASFWLSGWVEGKHTIRVELIGPDGWPYKNGNANIVTREVVVTK